ncbi:hypothetical protein B0I72DRAFT_155432 [Yarrowia lipolytica]|uniref:Uncharacterized protein n=1 Tax=Yarrowia lipolytica TaxID=4952 RepID=A0A371BXR4_YARLL|nr:hypothetical protein B0I71DRAFT_177689 [Yarrowia lipolytica]RDW29587.1 hypothetical protein B0I72DRAFT_155432 [Yarrowia lipolytica]
MEPTNRYNYLTSFWIAPELIRRPDETKDVAETPVVNPWLDVSLGTGSGSRSSQGSLASDIARIKPQEIVREKQMKELELDNGEFYPEIDSRSIEALELFKFKAMRDARTKGSLLSTLNGTKTDAGHSV